MEPWQKLIQALCEIWVEEDIKNGKALYVRIDVVLKCQKKLGRLRFE